MTKKAIRKQLCRFASAIEIQCELDNGDMVVVHRASKPISGARAGRILNNKNYRDIILSFIGISISELQDDGTYEDIYPKFDKNKKYIVCANHRGESHAMMFAEIKEFKGY